MIFGRGLTEILLNVKNLSLDIKIFIKKSYNSKYLDKIGKE